MLLRSVVLLLLALGSQAGRAAEPAPATAADAAATSDAAPSADTAASPGNPEAADGEAGEDEPGGSLDGEGFVPSVQISEDLSVSFPTDI